MDLCRQSDISPFKYTKIVLAFLPRSKGLLISWLQSLSAEILEHKKIKSVTVSNFPPTYLPWSDGTDVMISVFGMLSFKPTFSLSSFTFIKRLFSSSSLYAIRVVSSAYPRLMIFLWQSWFQLVHHPVQHFAWCALHNLNKQGDNIQLWHTPFPILNQYIVTCPALTVASWLAYRFLRRWIWWSGIPISKNFSQFDVIYTVKRL